MNKFLNLCALIAIMCSSCSLPSAKNNRHVSKEVNIAQTFNTIIAETTVDVHYTHGNKVVVKVTAPEYCIDDVNVSDLNTVASGHSDISISGVRCDNITATASGSSDIDLDRVDASSVACVVSGNSELDINGRTAQVTFEASGNSSIDAEGLQAGSGTATASGLSEIKCRVANLSQSTSGMASIRNR